MKKLLGYLVHNANSDEQKDIKELTLAMDVFGEGSGFDPSGNSYIRVAVYKLRKKLAEYYRTDGKNDEIVIDIPRGMYNVRFSVNDSRNVADFQFIQENGIIIPKPISLYLPPLDGALDTGNRQDGKRSVFLSCLLSYLSSYQYLGISFKRNSCDYALNLCHVEEQGSLVFYLSLEDSISGRLLWNRTLQYCGGEPYIDWVEVCCCTTALQIGSTVGVAVRNTVLTDSHRRAVSSRVVSDLLKPIFTVDTADIEESIGNIRSYPNIPMEHPALLGGMAHLYSMSYVLDVKKDPDLLYLAGELSRRSLCTVPDEAFALLSMVRINFLQGSMKRVVEISERIFASLGIYSLISLVAAYYNAAASGEWERPMGIIRRIDKIIPEPPSFIHFYLFLYELHRNNLDRAQIEFYQMPDSRDPGFQILKIAFFMKTGRIEEALSLYYDCIAIYPGFELDQERYLAYLKNENSLLHSLEGVFNKVLVLQ